jgi:Zn-dependent protease with chaperone function
MLLRIAIGFGLLGLATACDVVSTSDTKTGVAPLVATTSGFSSVAQAWRAFASVATTMEPVIERECRTKTTGLDCDFRIVIDGHPNSPANAYQSLDANKRPIIAFTQRLILDAGNADELAFVMGHEGAHHILNHIGRQNQNSVAGAVILGGLATLTGAAPAGVADAVKLGAQFGVRGYSKDHELEADYLGAKLTALGGYSPVIGSEFIKRIPDPGDRFLGTHPSNGERLQVVQTALSEI